jgi:ribosomal protein S18 acetylase RimI-like enzyme
MKEKNTEVRFINNLEDFEGLITEGFFVGWPNPPSSETLKKVIINSQHYILAIDKNRLVGFINAISDKTLSAYIPLLEVLPEYKGRGIGSKLVYLMKEELSRYYMVDISCDDNIVPFYEKHGFKRNNSMYLRNYEKQSGSISKQ